MAPAVNKYAHTITLVQSQVRPIYLRFVVGAPGDDWRWLTGILGAAGTLREESRLEPYQVDVAESAFEWFNEHLPHPPFEDNLKSGVWSQDAVSWFLPDAKDFVRRMWDLVAVLKDHDVPVRMLSTPQPGLIVYRDKYQVVAETPIRN
jgi:hypothetical protein